MKILICLVIGLTSVYSQSMTWEEYKKEFGKNYSATDDVYRNIYFTNVASIINNYNYENGLRPFQQGYSAITDVNFNVYLACFTAVSWTLIDIPKGKNITIENTNNLPDAFELDTSEVEITDQTNYGDLDAFTCNYGWAFAVAKAVEIYGIHHSKYPSTTSLSAQQLIDCWGIDNCKAGFPHKALEYLTKYHQVLYSANNYRYVAKKNDFCTIDISGYPEAGSLKGFSTLEDNAKEEDIKSVLYNLKTPIIIEINPNVNLFMTYKSGVYNTVSYNIYSHFMLIVGYGLKYTTEKNIPIGS
uniref:Peptidase C1A papain C-terminal domain-containing protein n=1 Tax=Megaselia scalaris TaxID=36166 RepID=T1GHZ6_MEGSC